MLFNEFERLVNYAVGGSMVDAEVTDVVKQLKNEKTNIIFYFITICLMNLIKVFSL